MIIFVFIYSVSSIFWILLNIDKDSFYPKTYGELIVTILLLPTVILILILNKIANLIVEKLYAISNNSIIKTIKEIIYKFWNKSIFK